MGQQEYFVIKGGSEFDIHNNSFPFMWSGRQWRNVFQAYQATKFLCSKKRGARQVVDQIHAAESKDDIDMLVEENVKKVARQWDLHKYDFMKAIAYAQIKDNSTLRDILMASEDRIILDCASPHLYWGYLDGVGKNNHGLVLQEIRGRIRKERGSN